MHLSIPHLCKTHSLPPQSIRVWAKSAGWSTLSDTQLNLKRGSYKNTLDCDQSNVGLYSSRVVFSAISQDLLFRSFSLYRSSASDPPLWYVSNLHHCRFETEGKVWSPCMHTVNQILWCWDMAIWSFPWWPTAAILNLIQPEMALFDPPSLKTPPRTKHEVDRPTRRWDMAVWNFPKMCEWGLRSVVGRWSVVNIHTSYTDLITPLSLR